MASSYPNHPEPLWNLPGGRQREGELLRDTVAREFREETSLDIEIDSVRYVSESYDRATATHFLSVAFGVRAGGEARVTPGDAHAVGLAWVAPEDLATHLRVAVVREPLLAHLANSSRRYFGFADAGITIEFRDAP